MAARDSILVPVLFVLATATPSSAQAPGDSTAAPGAPAAIRDAFGLTELDGRLIGIGRGYKARFDARGFEFSTAVGRGAAAAPRMKVSLETIRRGDAVLWSRPAEAVAPLHDGATVRYLRGGGIEDRCEVRLDGVEQSFHFASRPAGSGDLIVRLAIATDLPLADAGDSGLRFASPGIGGVSIGRAVAIDARGRRTHAPLRPMHETDRKFLQIAVPSAFVDAAAYPMVLDPLFGPAFDVAAGPFEENAPDVAYDSTHDVFFVVWSQNYGDYQGSDIYGQRVSSAGALVGPAVVIEEESAAGAAVAGVRAAERFLVAYSRSIFVGSTKIFARAVGAVGGGPSAAVLLSDNLPGSDDGSVSSVDVGGASRVGQFDAYVVWKREDENIQGRRVTVGAVGAPELIPPNQLISAISLEPGGLEPAISKHAGESGRWLVTWKQPDEPEVAGFEPAFVYGRVVDASGVAVSPPTPFTWVEDAGPDGLEPDCAGDGEKFLVVWKHDADWPGSPPRIFGRDADYDPAAEFLFIGESQQVLFEDAAADAFRGRPSIDFCGEIAFCTDLQFTVAFTSLLLDFEIGELAVKVLTVGGDPPVLLAGPEYAAPDERASVEPAVCSQRSGGLFAGSRSLIVMEGDLLASVDVVAALHDCMSISASVIGPGCGTKGGKASVSCGGAAGALFTHVLAKALPSASGYLVIGIQSGAPPASSPCPCALVPVPSAMIPIATSSSGAAAVPATVPPLAVLQGLTLVDQWIVFTSTAKCKNGFDLSNALIVTIE